jgi:hypothetical protein
VPPNEARIGDRDSLELTPVIERPRSRPPCPGRPSTDSKVTVAVAVNGLSFSHAVPVVRLELGRRDVCLDRCGYTSTE